MIKLQFLDPSLGGGSQEMPLGVNERVARNSVQFPPGGYQVLAQPVHRLRESSRSPAEVPLHVTDTETEAEHHGIL